MVIGSYVLIIILNVNGLNTNQKQRLAGGMSKMCMYVHMYVYTCMYLPYHST